MQKILDCLVPTLILVPTKVDPTTEEQNCKWDMVSVKGAANINMILALLKDFLGGARVLDDCFDPEGMNLCRASRSLTDLLCCTW